jgi:saposin
MKLVDYYVPLFFSEIARINPGELCERFNFCESAQNSSKVHGNSSYGFCEDTVIELLVELNDPDTKVSYFTDLLHYV